MTKQFKRQQQQFDTMMGKMKSLVTNLQTQTVQALTSFRQGKPFLWDEGERGEHIY